MARSLGSATCTDATRESHHCTQNAGTFRSPVPRPVPRVQLVGLGLLGLSWADGAGVTRLPPQPPHNLNLVATSILEHEVPAGGNKEVASSAWEFVLSGALSCLTWGKDGLRVTERPQATRGGAMSVIMTLQVVGDPKAIEQFASDNTEKAQGILEAAKRHGLIAHRFYGSDDGASLMVLDEWPDRQNFESFFKEQESELRPMFEAARVTAQIEPTFWRELVTHDAYGWGV